MSRLDGEVELQTRSLKMDVQLETPLGLSDDLCSTQRRVNRSWNPSRIVAESGDAFVTTKEKGMGIGLAVSRSIIQAHDGQLWAENNPDYGADFSIRLPVASVGATSTCLES
jgi:hypothetical protein